MIMYSEGSGDSGVGCDNGSGQPDPNGPNRTIGSGRAAKSLARRAIGRAIKALARQKNRRANIYFFFYRNRLTFYIFILKSVVLVVKKVIFGPATCAT